MATTPRDRLEREKDKLEALGEPTASALHELAVALDDEKVRHKFVDEDGSVSTYAPRSVERYVQGLRIITEDGVDLTAITAEEFNAIIDDIHDEQGKAKTTLSGYQIGARKFYRYHDFGVDPDDIHVFTERSEPRHDETDVFTEADVEALREACGETRNPVRNRALLELLIFTGQRIRALVTLRIGDLDLDEGYLFLNDEVEGLKDATKRSRKRPLFGARKYVRDWVQYHPRGGDDDAWLFIGDPSHWKTDPDDHWAEVSADHVLRRMAGYADVDKPVNPHNFRHYFVTVMHRDYDDIDTDTIRMLMGVSKTSDVLETTYSHVTDEDFIQKAEAAVGYGDDEPERPRFTPESCPTCGELIKPEWRRCPNPNCNEVFVPDGEELIERLESLGGESVLDLLESLDEMDPESLAGLRALGEAAGEGADLAVSLTDLMDQH